MVKWVAVGSLFLFNQNVASASFHLWGASATIFERQAGQEISSGGSCGMIDGVNTTCLGSFEGNCCSFLNYCGSNSSYCGSGCQTAYGECGNSRISTDGSCGGDAQLTCLGASMGNCCSAKNFCGDTSAHCGQGCQLAFGDCYSSTAANTTDASSSTPSASSSDESVTESAGFIAGISVMAVVLASGILGLIFWIWRRRRRGDKAVINEAPGLGMYDRKELPDEGQGDQPYHELSGQRHQEIDSSARLELSGVGDQNDDSEEQKGPNGGEAFELPGDGGTQRSPR